jgi:hypothetical protein
MKARLGNPGAAPLMIWNSIGGRAFELMSASAEVIAHRTNRMWLAGVMPSVDDQQEFSLMVHEKIDACVRSTSAMATQLFALGPLFGMQWAAQALRISAATMALAGSRTVEQSVARQAALSRTIQSRHARRLTNDMGRLVHEGLKPFHAAAVANATRLKKRR